MLAKNAYARMQTQQRIHMCIHNTRCKFSYFRIANTHIHTVTNGLYVFTVTRSTYTMICIDSTQHVCTGNACISSPKLDARSEKSLCDFGGTRLRIRTHCLSVGKETAFYAFYAFYAWWIYFPQSGALAEGTSRQLLKID
jgi:hypothetical protein